MPRLRKGARLLLHWRSRASAKDSKAGECARHRVILTTGRAPNREAVPAVGDPSPPVSPTPNLMRLKQILVASVVFIGALLGSSACSKAQQPPSRTNGTAAQPAPPQQAVASPQELQLYTDAARTSWNFINRITEPSTGLARAHANYANVTLWDIAGVIAANYVAHDLGFIDDATYDSHISRILATLSTIDLFDKAA